MPNPRDLARSITSDVCADLSATGGEATPRDPRTRIVLVGITMSASGSVIGNRTGTSDINFGGITMSASGSVTQAQTISGTSDVQLGGITMSASGSVSTPSAGALPSSTVFELDATDSSSYGGSGQTFANLTSSPADSASQTDYDFFLGTTSSAQTNDPTFTGTAGDSAAYFAHDGGDFFSINGGNTTFLNNIFSSNQDFWFAIAFRSPGTHQAFSLCGNVQAVSQDGFRVLHDSAVGVGVQVLDGTVVYSQFAGASSRAPLSSDVLVVVSVDWNVGANVYVNGTKYALANATRSTTTGTPAAFQLAAARSNDIFPNGMRSYGFAMGNSALTDTEAADLKTYFEDAHGKTYS